MVLRLFPVHVNMYPLTLHFSLNKAYDMTLEFFLFLISIEFCVTLPS